MREAIKIIGRIRFGSVNNLKARIGEDKFNNLLQREYIIQGKMYPDVWRITDKGIKRSLALEKRWCRFLAYLLWKSGLLH